jgi:NTP pyrophosphatase (non-canonical NTP hydrolase)
LYAADAVHEFPFTRPGLPSRLEGRDEIVNFIAAGWQDYELKYERYRTVPSLNRHPQLREELMWDQVGQLHAYHGDVPVEIRLLKLTEEVGEVADAFLGIHGLNKRKGVCRSRDDLLDELADVIITAAVAMSGITGDVGEARSHLERRLAVVTERAGL